MAKNYVLGVRAWHLLHGLDWSTNDTELEALLKAADKSAPSTSKWVKRAPFTIAYMIQLKSHLSLNDPLHAAVWACLTTVFYGAARLGEFTLKTLRAFDSEVHIKPSDVRDEVDRQGRRSQVFHIPHTKTAPAGEDVSLSRQNGETDLEATFTNHLNINNPLPDSSLFAYLTKGKAGHPAKHKHLTKTKVLEVLVKAAERAGEKPLQGHGIRIGATLEYLLRGVPFEVMKVKGRWASDTFLTYLRKHAQILAPYMQANSQQNEEFIRIVMPAGRR
ncbi:hypothetical protein BJ165DRAFT_1404953 [Panaeolus papilionaceus]|nr:hypothetical protein BJ165DRAFT_1404953 [Panaeolus papilionaceus]